MPPSEFSRFTATRLSSTRSAGGRRPLWKMDSARSSRWRTADALQRRPEAAMTEFSGPPSVSIVIATFNVANLIENCLLSIFSQTHRDLEIVVVDGGSTDGTIDILGKFGDRLKWTSERDYGLNDAQWKGVRRASAEWILFLGADDVLASPKALENLFRKCPADLSPYDILTGHALY